jgi:AcrR family transcriptional regulator
MVRPSQTQEELFDDSDTLQRILDAASAEFATRGFEGATLQRIAERAGVGRALISYHYRDKETLWREAAAFLYGRLARRLRDLGRELSRVEPRRRIRRLLIEFVIGASQSRLMSFAFAARGSERNEWLRTHYADPIRHFVCGVIEDAQQEGDLPPADPELHYELLAGASILRSWRTDVDKEQSSAEELERQAGDLVDLLLRTER